MLNLIVWNIYFFDIETVYLCLIDFFEIKLIICIKIDSALMTSKGRCAIEPHLIKPKI